MLYQDISQVWRLFVISHPVWNIEDFIDNVGRFEDNPSISNYGRCKYSFVILGNFMTSRDFFVGGVKNLVYAKAVISFHRKRDKLMTNSVKFNVRIIARIDIVKQEAQVYVLLQQDLDLHSEHLKLLSNFFTCRLIEFSTVFYRFFLWVQLVSHFVRFCLVLPG